MSATHVTVKITVDPAGRVLVHECERTLASDKVNIGGEERDLSGHWQGGDGCVTYYVNVMLPTPSLEAPTADIAVGFRGKPVRFPE